MTADVLAITRCALLTPLGDTEQTWDGICAGKRVEERRTVSDDFLTDDPALDRSLRIGLAVGGLAWENSSDHNTALFCGTSKGPVGIMLAACEKLRQGKALSQSEAHQIILGPAAMGEILRQRLQLNGPAHTSVAACSSGLHALHRAVEAVRRGECERTLVVAADASLHPLFEGSFDRLGVLAPRSPDGLRRCEPYTEPGQGFFIAEAGAAVLLEKIESHHANQNVLACLENSWIGADGTHLIAVDDQMRTLRTGLQKCAPAEPLAFVHGHGTGTAHDRHELAAIRDQTRIPPGRLFSHKKWLGHSLGAAGLVAVVLSTLCHKKGKLPNGLPLSSPARSLTIAQGFGGHIGLVRLRA